MECKRNTNGNNLTGIVSASQNFSSIYKAPSQVPDQNPVAVSVEFKGSSTGIIEKQFKNLKLVSNILIYDDAWEVKMTGKILGFSRDAWGGLVVNRDEGSFILSLEKNEPAVVSIKNHLEVLINNCTRTILNPTTCTGIFHIAGTKRIKVTPANPPAQPYQIVEIWFVQHPIELTRYQFICPPPPGIKESAIGKIDLASGFGKAPPAMLLFFGMPAIPSYLKFVAKDGEQVLIQKGEENSEVFYKIWVKKNK